MDWIKKNYDQFLLALLAVGLIAASALLFMNAQKFPETFSEAMAAPNKSRKVPEVDTTVIGNARQKLANPTTWQSGNHSGLLFTSEGYYVKDGQLRKPIDDSLYAHSRSGEKIPNTFFLNNKLPLADATVPFQDPDGDGFPNEDEWLYKTNPNDKASHPEYYTLAFLNKWIRNKFRLKFQAYDGDPKTPEKMTFQINPLDAGARTEFVQQGDVVAGTKYKVAGFEFKEVEDPGTGGKRDVSELTVINTETNDPVKLVYGTEVNSPEEILEIDYRWNTKTTAPGQIFRVQKKKDFILKPLIDQKYKLLDVNETEAVIETPTGEKVSIKPYPKK